VPDAARGHLDNCTCLYCARDGRDIYAATTCGCGLPSLPRCSWGGVQAVNERQTDSAASEPETVCVGWCNETDCGCIGEKPPTRAEYEETRSVAALTLRPRTNYRIFVSEDGKTFVRFWADDKTVEVATRDNSWETWGPPTLCMEEK
jgi:hypothetical protein